MTDVQLDSNQRFSLLFFPGNGSASTFLMAGKGEEMAHHLSRGRPSNIRRPTTYPCTVVNPGNSQKVKVQPLIGTSDDGVYLNPADIHKLGLGDTGQTIVTRHGPCKVYSGVSFFLRKITMAVQFATTYHIYFAWRETPFTPIQPPTQGKKES
ncbi:uncharacterized protein EV420DRAFT_1523975 [Desarmillaria tabescens]|uniref:Uncharacterized protein n=1 Tax=Armillaria tabescens TaxID=1929756 RepID=A0AA39NAZ8_ARMTA|nr:uncharacterized protein EV420DRAFT_1523975 [Desarmillaria tabescens]KAK0462302.1 hypothetical protein EV420DRAFT_1523975 [Desarmillaria tabescens]